jgi:hypothetical protein
VFARSCDSRTTRTQDDDEGHSVGQWEGQAKRVELVLDSRITVHCASAAAPLASSRTPSVLCNVRLKTKEVRCRRSETKKKWLGCSRPNLGRVCLPDPLPQLKSPTFSWRPFNVKAPSIPLTTYPCVPRTHCPLRVLRAAGGLVVESTTRRFTRFNDSNHRAQTRDWIRHGTSSPLAPSELIIGSTASRLLT